DKDKGASALVVNAHTQPLRLAVSNFVPLALVGALEGLQGSVGQTSFHDHPRASFGHHFSSFPMMPTVSSCISMSGNMDNRSRRYCAPMHCLVAQGNTREGVL